MKKTSIPFCKDIPDTWREIPNKYLFSYCSKKVGENWKNYKLLSLTTSGVKVKDINASGGKVPDSYDNYQTVEPGDMIFCLFDLDVSAVFSGLSSLNGMITSAYDVVRTNNSLVTQTYIDYWFKYVFSNRYYKIYSKNIRYTIGSDAFASIKTPIPTIHEQKKISSFLDEKVSYIDTLIYNESKQINNLEEYLRSQIFETMTRGIGNSNFKESEIEWIGRIPNSWKISNLSSVVKERKNKNTGMIESNLLSLSYGRVIRKNVDNNEGLIPASFEGYNIIEKDDIVLRLTDLQNDHTSLRTGLCRERGIITSAYLTLEVNKNYVLPEFLHFLLHAFDLKKGFYGMGSGVRQSLGFDEVRKMKIVLPSLSEQKKIVEHLNIKYNDVKKLINLKQEKIKKMNDYKKSLIYECVTGKKEVAYEV